MNTELTRRVLEARRAGASYAQIASTLDMPEAECRALGDEALAAAAESLVFDAALEIDRVDRMQMAVWPKAMKGDPAAVDRALRLGERRERLASSRMAPTRALQDAFEVTVAALSLGPVDQALVQSGRMIAERVDLATSTGDGPEVTKALYLVPHLMNVLREMTATPAARRAVRAAQGSARETSLDGAKALLPQGLRVVS